jgi:hypothetical protein
MEAAEPNGSFEDSGWRYRGSQGAAESSDESDAPSRDDGSMGSGESDASAQATVLSSQVQHAQMRQGTAKYNYILTRFYVIILSVLHDTE